MPSRHPSFAPVPLDIIAFSRSAIARQADLEVTPTRALASASGFHMTSSRSVIVDDSFVVVVVDGGHRRCCGDTAGRRRTPVIFPFLRKSLAQAASPHQRARSDRPPTPEHSAPSTATERYRATRSASPPAYTIPSTQPALFYFDSRTRHYQANTADPTQPQVSGLDRNTHDGVAFTCARGTVVPSANP